MLVARQPNGIVSTVRGNTIHSSALSSQIRRKDMTLSTRPVYVSNYCLGPHRVPDCQSKYRCRFCPRKHHTSLCQEEPPASPSLNAVVKSTVAVHQINEVDTTIPPVASLHTVQQKDSQRMSTLLKTAVAPVQHHGRKVSARILFDERSQRSFLHHK